MDKLAVKCSLFRNSVASFILNHSFSILGKLLREDKITLDEHINEYVDYFPEKHFEGENVKITVRQLMSHTSGIRHYEKMLPKKKEPGNGHNDKETDEMDKKQEESASEKTKQKSQENGNIIKN